MHSSVQKRRQMRVSFLGKEFDFRWQWDKTRHDDSGWRKKNLVRKVGVGVQEDEEEEVVKGAGGGGGGGGGEVTVSDKRVRHGRHAIR